MVTRPIMRAISRAALCAAVCVVGCSPDTFTYMAASKGKLSWFDCHVLSPYGSVEYGGDSISIHAGGTVAARRLYQTFQETEFFVSVAAGDEMRVRTRSTDYGKSVYEGIALTLGRDHASVQEPGSAPRAIAARLDPGLTRVRIFSEGKFIQFVVGCDTVYSTRTTVPATDVIAFESVGGSEVRVRGLVSTGIR